MKYIKTLGLVAVAAAALTAFASPASATILTSPEGTTYTGELAAEAIGSGLTIHNSNGSYSCGQSKAKGKIEAHGAATTLIGKLVEWSLTSCNAEVKVLKLGTIEVHTEKEGSNGNGLVTVSGTEVTMLNTSTGVHCIYSTNNTPLGVLTGSNTTGGNARLVISSASIPRTGGSVLCNNSSILTAEYTVTTPSKLYVD